MDDVIGFGLTLFEVGFLFEVAHSGVDFADEDVHEFGSGGEGFGGEGGAVGEDEEELF